MRCIIFICCPLVPTGGGIQWQLFLYRLRPHNVTTRPLHVECFVGLSRQPPRCQQRSVGRLVGHRRPQINPRLLLGMMGRLMGPVRADRLTRFPSHSVPSAIYQTEVPSKQEFHTLLKMWLLSAAAPPPINRGSSFLPSLPCFPRSVSPILMLILQGGALPCVLLKEKAGSGL